jgi:hypothetical protein
MKDALILVGLLASPFALGGAVAAYDATQPVTVEYITDRTFAGDPVITKRTTSYLGNKSFERVGFYGGGRPRVIGFGCEGAAMPIVAMEEDYLPRCKAVEGITYPESGK